MTDFELNVIEEGFYKGEPCDDFKIHLLKYHPGVPGFTLKYNYEIIFKGERISARGCGIEADNPEVYFKADEILIPDRVRKLGGTLTISLFCSQDPDYTATLKIKMRKYELTLEDNFETYNPNLWNARSAGAKVAMAFTEPLDNYVRDNHLCLDFKKHETPTIRNGVECYYSDAGVDTKGKFSQKYGCFSTRMKLPEAPKGIFSAFWLVPDGRYQEDYFFKRTDTGDDFHGCSEIDVMEVFHDADTLGSAHTEHYWEPNWDRATQGITKSSLDNFYTIPGFKYDKYYEFACVWNEYGIYYYVDGELVRDNPNIAPVEDVFPAFVLFTCYIGPKGSGARFGEVEDKLLPKTLLVDWLKVYK